MKTPEEWERIRLTGTDLGEPEQKLRQLPFVEFIAEVQRDAVTPPIPMILYCPLCNHQHVDKPEPDTGWMNPPHRTHLCAKCKALFRPANVATTGVATLP